MRVPTVPYPLWRRCQKPGPALVLGPVAIPGSVITTFDDIWASLAGRTTGLTDDEYFWEPVAGCWLLRQGGTGRWYLDGSGDGGPAPTPYR
jgi:hypothetical protein